jgi:hypothetical protein
MTQTAGTISIEEAGRMSLERTYKHGVLLIFALANSMIVTASEPGPRLLQSTVPLDNSPRDNSPRDDSNDGDSSEPLKVPIETPEPGVRLYGTPSPFATWIHTDFSPDGQWLIGFQGTRMLVWDRKAARVAREFEVTDQGNVLGTQFSPNGNYLAVFVKHWKELPGLNDPLPDLDPESAEYLKSLLALQPKFQSQILVYDRQWRLVGEYDVSFDSLQQPEGLSFSSDASAILINGETNYGGREIAIIDLSSKTVHLPPQQLGPAVWISAREVAWTWPQRQAWDYRKDRVSRLPDDVLSDAYSAHSISDNGDWVLARTETGSTIVRLSTNRRIRLLDWRGYIFGQVSPDNRYFVGVGSGRASRQVLLLDLDSGEEIARADDWQIGSLKFVRGEPVVHLTLVAVGAGTRARSLTMTTAPLDDRFPAAVTRAQKALPVTDKILFTGKDRWLALANGWSWINLESSELAGQGQASRGVAKVATHPETDQVFTFGSPVDEFNNRVELAVTSQTREPNRGRQIFVAQAPTEIISTLRRWLGSELQTETTWSLNQQHLSTSLDGTQLRIVHSESKSSGQRGIDTRFRLTTWDIRRQKIPTTTELQPNPETANVPLHFNLSPDGKMYGIASGNRIWWGDTESGTLTKDVNLPGIATGLEFSADNRFVALGLVQAPWQTVWRWPVNRNLPLAHSIAVIEIETGLIRFQKRNLEVVGFGFQPQTHQLYILDRNHKPNHKRLTFYKPDTWEPTFQKETTTPQPLAMAMSSDGLLIAIPLADTRIEVWEIDKIENDHK